MTVLRDRPLNLDHLFVFNFSIPQHYLFEVGRHRVLESNRPTSTIASNVQSFQGRTAITRPW